MLRLISILFSRSLTIPILSLAIYLFISFSAFQSFETEKILYIDGASQLTTRSLKYLACSSIAFRSLFPSIPIFYSLLIHLTNCNAFLLKVWVFHLKFLLETVRLDWFPKSGMRVFWTMLDWERKFRHLLSIAIFQWINPAMFVRRVAVNL